MRVAAALAALAALATAAPVLEPRDGARVIKGQWILKLKDNADDGAFDGILSKLGGADGGSLLHRYRVGAFRAMAVNAGEALVQVLSGLSQIEFIEPDTYVQASAIVSQSNAPYGLARISSISPGGTTYRYDDSAGAGTVSYGIDTGIYCGNVEFEDRCTFGANFADTNNTDGNGHGTHTAGTFGGKTYGVAKKTQIIAVKVLDAAGSGSNSNVIKGIEWAANDMVARGKVGKAVANLSLGGPRLGEASNQAVAAAVKKGLFLSVAAGNSAQSTALSSPGSEPSVCTVAASDKNDKLASFSNYGSLVDVIAPGVDVLSAWIGGPTATKTISGTSMAAPHVAGLGAYLLALEGSKDPVALCQRIKDLSNKGKVALSLAASLSRTPNNLAYNGAAGAGATAPSSGGLGGFFGGLFGGGGRSS